ncbi:MAG: hypothetical protein KAI43_14025 [Candidatus Aureabacteria bacterium]|nr:hypothetical protein [Candidatus Auribacterota bacterium]
MKIKYESTLDEAIDCQIRLWWLRKSSRKKVLRDLLLLPLTWFFIAYLSEYRIKTTIIQSVILTTIYVGYLLYAYGKGYRNKIRKFILESLDGKPFPDQFECEINEEGIITKNTLHEIKLNWNSIKRIEHYKQYIEIVGTGTLVQIKKEYAPSIDEIIALWQKGK